MGGKGSGGHNRKREPKPLTEGRDPWAKQKGESGKAFHAFVTYRDQGPTRTLARTAEELGKSTGHIEQWSAVWSWVKRTHAWDQHKDEEARKAQIEAVRAMGERQAKLGVLMQDVGEASLKHHQKEPAKVSVGDARRLAVDGSKMERAARGEPEEVIEVKGVTDALSQMALNKVARALGLEGDDGGDDPEAEGDGDGDGP